MLLTAALRFRPPTAASVGCRAPTRNLSGTSPLATADPELARTISSEWHRQTSHLELIASENYASLAVMECLGSCLTNKYAEGLPGKRYYGGNEFIDVVERLCQQRALQAFRLDPAVWAVNVQPYSGSPANFSAYGAVLKPHDRIMGLDLPAGGHLTHGFATDKKRVSNTSIYFESMPYGLDANGYVDYDALEKSAALFRPRLIICGGSAYPREWDYARLRKIADNHGAWLLCDMAHISGLVAAQEAANPFDYCDLVTSTTHKTLRGPRAGMIFCRKTKGDIDVEEAVNNAVFPAAQGGPHEHQIAAIATALREVMTPEFPQYIRQVKANAHALASGLIAHGYKLVSGGTSNHLMLWDVRPTGLSGKKLERAFELAAISCNKNSVVGDTSAMNPGGIRLGTPAVTTRGMGTAEMQKIAELLHRGVQISLRIQDKSGKLLKDFLPALETSSEIQQLRAEVEAFAGSFPLPGRAY